MEPYEYIPLKYKICSGMLVGCDRFFRQQFNDPHGKHRTVQIAWMKDSAPTIFILRFLLPQFSKKETKMAEIRYVCVVSGPIHCFHKSIFILTQFAIYRFVSIDLFLAHLRNPIAMSNNIQCVNPKYKYHVDGVKIEINGN